MSNQVHRIIRILTLLSSGAKLTASQILEKIADEGELREVSLRQIQRDLKEIEAANVPLHVERDGRELSWSLPSEYRNLAPISVSEHELLSLHLLKGALGNFKGTRIERDVERLRSKIERLAPGTVFLQEELVSEISPGRFMNAVNDEVLEEILFAITDPRWDRVTSIGSTTPKTYVVSFGRLVNHAGRLYVVAWHPTYQQYITLAADRISTVKPADDVQDPPHVFNEADYRSGRFGVYDGKPVNVSLKIAADAASYFGSRHWHPTEKISHHRDGSMTLKMTVPISPELVSWIMGWAGSLEVKGPQALVDECKQRARKIARW